MPSALVTASPWLQLGVAETGGRVLDRFVVILRQGPGHGHAPSFGLTAQAYRAELQVDHQQSHVIVAQALAAPAFLDPAGEGGFADRLRPAAPATLGGSLALLVLRKEPLGQGVGHEQEAVARPPAAAGSARVRSMPRGRAGPRAEQARPVAEIGRARQRERAAAAGRRGRWNRQQSPTARARQSAGLVRGRRRGSARPRKVAKAPCSRLSSAYQGSGSASTSAAQRCRSGASQSRLARACRRGDEVLDQQAAPRGRERRLRGAVGDGEAAAGGIAGEGVLVVVGGVALP